MIAPSDIWQARVLFNSGRITSRESVAAIRDLRWDTVIPGQHPRVILSECKPIKRRKR